LDGDFIEIQFETQILILLIILYPISNFDEVNGMCDPGVIHIEHGITIYDNIVEIDNLTLIILYSQYQFLFPNICIK